MRQLYRIIIMALSCIFCFAAIADDECPVGYGYATLVNAASGGCVDLGTLDWSRYKVISQSVTRFNAQLPNVYAEGFKPNIYSNIYHASSKPIAPVFEDKALAYYDGDIYLFNSDYENATPTQFKQAMSGVILYYQHETDTTWTPPRDDTVCNFDTSSYGPYGEYTLPEVNGCTLCPANTYKDFVGNEACIPCPNGTMSPAGATSIDQCGHILHVGGYVAFMPVGRRTEHGLCTMFDGKKYCADMYEKQ